MTKGGGGQEFFSPGDARKKAEKAYREKTREHEELIKSLEAKDAPIELPPQKEKEKKPPLIIEAVKRTAEIITGDDLTEDAKVVGEALKQGAQEVAGISKEAGNLALNEVFGEDVVEDVKRNWPSLKKAINKFLKWGSTQSNKLKNLLGHDSEHRKAVVGTISFLAFITLVTIVILSRQEVEIDRIGIKDDTFYSTAPDGSLIEEGSNELNYQVYKDAAISRWETFKQSGYLPGAMFDPMATENLDTILLTAYIPGWMCVPQRVAACEQMLGTKLEIPENKEEKDKFFRDMKLDWEEKWLPMLLNNPNIPKEVKDFYRPENRQNLRDFYRSQRPVDAATQESFLKDEQGSGDDVFVNFLTTGKLNTKDEEVLRQSPLLATLSGDVFEELLQDRLMQAEATGNTALAGEIQAAINQLEQVTQSSFKTARPVDLIDNWLVRSVDKKIIGHNQLKKSLAKRSYDFRPYGKSGLTRGEVAAGARQNRSSFLTQSRQARRA